MAEHSIRMTAREVRAILAGTKTQTRRVVKPDWLRCLDPDDDRITVLARCPFGQPGDLLWVRETFYCDHAFYPDGTPPGCYWDGPKAREKHTPEQMAKERVDMLEAMYYRADGEPEWEGADGRTPWRPSIHMPRWASRITLRVTDVRVERLQDISEADARAEGAQDAPLPMGLMYSQAAVMRTRYREGFGQLWCSINGAASWDSNPWVWVVSFERVGGANG